MVANADRAADRRWLLKALSEDEPVVTPSEMRVAALYRRWRESRGSADYREFGAIKAVCPHARVSAYRRPTANGAEYAYLRCRSCGANPRGEGRFLALEVVRGCGIDTWMLPLEPGTEEPEDDVCAHCKERKPGEQHHFAPQGRFRDPDAWPLAYLCLDCHKRWHDVMGWGNEPWARKEA